MNRCTKPGGKLDEPTFEGSLGLTLVLHMEAGWDRMLAIQRGHKGKIRQGLVRLQTMQRKTPNL